MLHFIKKAFEDKKEYRDQMARAEALPEEYRFVFQKIHGYIWSLAGGDGSDVLKAQEDLIELFETSAAEGKKVLDVTGKDVAGFCDEFLRDAKKWTDSYRKKLNHSLINKYGQGSDSK